MSAARATRAAFVAKESVVAAADAANFVKFVDASPSPFHATATAVAKLEAAGFTKLSEKETWSVKGGGKYYLTRNQSTVFAFAVGGAWTPGNGFSIVGAHTDSPCLRIKPRSAKNSMGYMTVGVECYGGGLWHTWFDRDLSIAGRVIVKDGDRFKTRLVKIDRPIMRVPTLAIHLNREVNSKGFLFNKETHLAPVLATEVKNQLGLNGEAGAGAGAGVAGAGAGGSDIAGNHHSLLMDLIAEELGVSVDTVHDFELCLFDTQGGAIGGAHNEFVFAPRLDNLMMSFTGTEALIRSVTGDSLASDPTVRMVALFDNEEVGSGSMMGAASTMMAEVITRISGGTSEVAARAFKKSLLVSADMAHAIHPNYTSKHEANHRPELHKGMVIKNNANQRYATTSVTSFLLKQVAKRAGVPVQEFVVRQDMGCGSTIGPILSQRTGMRTVDVGLPQLSMHSCREMCGTDDVSHGINLFTELFNCFAEVDASLDTEE